MEYADLGLPSGTLWAESNEEGYYTFDEAVEKYGNSLPTREQLEELKSHCQWEWNDKEYDRIDHYEIAEYGKNSWTTEYTFPVMPSHFAYIPNIIEMAERCHNQHKSIHQ